MARRRLSAVQRKTMAAVGAMAETEAARVGRMYYEIAVGVQRQREEQGLGRDLPLWLVVACEALGRGGARMIVTQGGYGTDAGPRVTAYIAQGVWDIWTTMVQDFDPAHMQQEEVRHGGNGNHIAARHGAGEGEPQAQAERGGETGSEGGDVAAGSGDDRSAAGSERAAG